ncbi:hypothetical protein CSA37_08470 [Candidatus Fermentibacteria bacterium]|nr:MAG: hypothetical protein CSA37_08470 [Candidatus Fermentibacteria bacterium]
MVLQAALTALFLFASPDAVHLNYSVVVHLNENGAITEQTSTAVIPLNGMGVQHYSALSISFREGMEDIRVTEARVGHWRGGRGSSEGYIETGPHSMLSGAGRMESSYKETLVTMPGVEVGDTVYLEIERIITELPLSDVYSYTFSPVMEDSVASSSFTVINDSERQLISTDSRSSFVFSASSPLPEHPLAEYCRNYVSIASGTPEELSADASQTLSDLSHTDCAEIGEILQETGSSPEALRAWVAENITYIGAEAGLWPGWSPRTPKQTLEDRSGVCRDRAVLLTWMLLEAGYEAYPALVSSSGETPSLVDGRSFDHMITVYREGDSAPWQLLDPTPEGLPENAGISFGLRGAGYLPVTPSGSQLNRIPVTGWNDTLDISITGTIAGDLITGTLEAEAFGAPLELVSTLYTRSAPSLVNEMFRRFFGAAECSDVTMSGNKLTVHGTWHLCRTENALLLPGLRDVSLPGTRLASMLLPVLPDSFLPDAPAVEILTITVPSPWPSPVLPEECRTAGYSSSVAFEEGNLILHESADLSAGAEGFSETLYARSGTSARTVVSK